jgi:hypothetical protein
MANLKLIDIDAALGDDDAPVATRPFKLFGRNWTLLCDLNSFALSDLATGEPAAIVRFLNSIVAEDEREDFRSTLASQPNLTAEKLGKILTALVEAATDRPTTPASASGSTAPKRTSQRKSAASSSTVRVVR